MPVSLFASGFIDLGFALFHLMFWRLFNWPESLKASGHLNTAITQTLNVVLTYVFAAYGGALMWFALSGRSVPPQLVVAGAGFWALRALLQLLLFRINNAPSAAIFVVFLVAAVTHGLAAYWGA